MPATSPLLRELLEALTVLSELLATQRATAIYRSVVYPMYIPRYSRREVGRALSILKYRGYIRTEHDRIELTPKGIERARRYKLETLSLDTSGEWDGIWRVVIWDVPERQRRQRNQIRLVLRHLGFVRIQQSIWVTPHPCREPIDYLRERFELQRSLVYLEASFIEDQARLRRRFGLTSPQALGEPSIPLTDGRQ